MRRWIIRIPLCLVLGVATTVLSAWLSAWFFQETGSYQALAKTSWKQGSLRIDRGSGLGGAREVMNFDNGDDQLAMLRAIKGAWQNCMISRRIDDPAAYFIGWGIRRVDGEYGWPFRAMHMTFEWSTGGTGWVDENAWLPPVGLESGAPRPERGALPLGVLPLAFAIDSILFAFFWTVVLALLANNVGIRRRFRGLCPRCGYDLRGQVRQDSRPSIPGCPECGWNRHDEAGDGARDHGA